MTSITATQSHHQMMSPRERLQKELDAEISSGTVQASDRTALETALDAIDETMQASRPTRGSDGPPKPEEMQQKISDLVDQQVEAGTLTSDQADELKQLFAAAAPQGGPGGPGGAGGPPPPPPQDESSDTSSSSASSSSATDVLKLLEDFLKQLQEKKGTTTAYGTDGSSNASSVTALVLDATV